MIISYEKENFLKRIWKEIFHKREALPVALEYTQKEVTLRLEGILDYLKNGFDFRNKSIEKFDNNIRNVNMYFFEKNQKDIENTLETYIKTVGKRKVRLNGNMKLVFNDPILIHDNVLEVFPNLNIPKLSRKDYIMQIYFNAVKLFARKMLKTKRITKHTTKTIYSYGINRRSVIVYCGRISNISKTEYKILNDIFAYIIAQILYEGRENEPFTFEISNEQNKQLKMVKYYISRSYVDYGQFILDYMLCSDRLEEKIVKNNDINNFSDLEEKLKNRIKK